MLSIIRNFLFNESIWRIKNILGTQYYLMLISLIIISCVIFIDFDVTFLGQDFISPSAQLFDLFPYWRSTARGLVVIEFCLTSLAVILTNRLFYLYSNKIFKTFLMIIIVLGTFFQTGLNPFHNNFTITKLKGDNVFNFLKYLNEYPKNISLTSWGEFEGYGMWITYSNLKVSNNIFYHSVFTSLNMNSMSFMDPQFMCNHEIIKSNFLVILNVPSEEVDLITIPYFKRIASFDSVRIPNSFDIVFKKDRSPNFKNSKSYPAFYREDLQILNREFSLFVINSSNTSIKIAPVSDKYLGMNAKFNFGLSSDSYAEFVFVVRNSRYNFFTQPQKITQVNIPVLIGDNISIKRIYPSTKENSPFYISSPHTSTC
jgi:hypothetical protein